MIKIGRIVSAVMIVGLSILMTGCKIAVMQPQGIVAVQEKHIIIISAVLMLLVVIPVIFLSIFFAWRYRASNTKAIYRPEWAHSTLLEIVWWTIPIIIVTVLGVITWRSTHTLDPYQPLAGNTTKPITIQVIALEWKWLFIYPEQNIATVNFVEFPANIPVKFEITSVGPMNSFQIPQLAGQIYAMDGMRTKLNLIANTPGDYDGMSASFSGEGFADMRFVAHATATQEEFNEWVSSVKASPNQLTDVAYAALIKPSERNPVAYYASADPDIFSGTIMQSMMPMPNGIHMQPALPANPASEPDQQTKRDNPSPTSREHQSTTSTVQH